MNEKVDHGQVDRHPAVHRPRSRLRAAATLLSPAAHAAGTVALERQQGPRVARLLALTLDTAEQRLRPTRPRMRSIRLTSPGRLIWQDPPVPQLPGPYGALVRPVAMATCDLDRPLVGDTLSDAYRHIAPHLEQLRRHPDGPGIILLGAVRSDSIFSPSVPLYAAQMARALIPEATLVLVDARAGVREEAARLGVDNCPPQGLKRRQAPLVIDCTADPRGLAAALAATSPDGICRCAGTLHASVPIPATRMFGRNSTLIISRSHVRTLMPAVLDLVAAGRLHPEKVTTTVAPFDDAPAALSAHLKGQITKTVLVAADRTTP